MCVAINSVYFITEHWFLCRVRHARAAFNQISTLLAGTVSLGSPAPWRWVTIFLPVTLGNA